MRISLAILVIMVSMTSGGTQVINHVFVQDAHWMDGTGSIDIIAFDNDGIYRQYKWFTSSNVLKQVNYGSYNVIEDTVLCQSLSTKVESIEFVITQVNKKYKLVRNEKVYIIDDTLSELRLHPGFYGEELTREQYKEFKALRSKNRY